MTSTSYVDNFEDSLENLSDTLNRNLTLMQELDSRCHQLMSKIDQTADNYMTNVKEKLVDKNNETLASIQSQFDTAKKFSDDKVQLSLNTYKVVDKHIRKLDSVLARLNAEIEFKAEFRDAAINSTRNLPLKKGGSNMTSAAPSVSAVNDGKSLTNVAVNTSSLNTGALVGAGVKYLAKADMPIDPNEPKFCLCNQVSFGKMVGCDNPDCPIEWFHFGCVNLIAKPKGKWFCPKCLTDEKEK
ncbi:inhibitor of growth protein 5-like [Acyrthosiphon pisum]|uniref:Inhibitor of growth protein n=1 Tax=Acyrthosiphon pisum TaxID=7029 RepID=A0A8R2JLK0_ACYPI|nr:inhibitor of growth protein 5-like [Acyrthosiphon pisum]|eukprot:XP_016661696.1 PREDICTED: inhibitor of growth protein 5-like [Acyrthosiphon pisum]